MATMVQRLAVGLAALAAFGAQAQELKLKTGGWQTTYKMQGQMQRLPESIEKMPPEQRAKMEAAMQRAMAPKERVHKTCLTKDDLAQMARDPDGDGQCKYSNVKRSASLYEADMTCPEGRKGHIRVEAQSSERVSGTVTQSLSGASGQGQHRMEFSGRWASASCKGYDD